MKKHIYPIRSISNVILTLFFVFFVTILFAKMPSDIQNGTIVFNDSLIAPQHANRFFIFPSAFPLKKKEVYYRTFLLVHQVNAGVSKNFEVSAATIPLFFFDGTATPIWMVPKVSYPINKNFRVGVSGLIGTLMSKRRITEVINKDDPVWFSFFHGVISYQNQNISLSAGGGFGRLFGDQLKSTYTLNALVRVKKDGFVMIESFYTPNSSIILKGLNFIGGRKVWKNNIFLDFGLIIPTPNKEIIERELDIDYIAMPWVNVAIPIRGKWSQ